jgi:hypothetical protein
MVGYGCGCHPAENPDRRQSAYRDHLKFSLARLGGLE